MTVEESVPATEDELNAALRLLLERAAANGVDVRGGWECRTGQSDWDVVVTELAAADGAE